MGIRQDQATLSASVSEIPLASPRLASSPPPSSRRGAMLAVFLLVTAPSALFPGRLRAQVPQTPQAPPAASEGAGKPLPPLQPFLQDVRERLHTDEFLLDQYTFTEKHVERQLDAKGGTQKVKTETFEVYPSSEPGHTYRRLIEKDGRALTSAELAEEDRKHEKKVSEAASPEADAKRAAKLAESRRREASAVAQLFEVYDLSIVRREPVEGRDAIVVDFRPKPGISPTGRTGKVLKTFAGRAWIDEADRQVVRVDAELVDTLSFGMGILARLHKGSRASLLRKKVNGEIWLPAEARFAGSARVLLLKGIRMEATSEYSDYRKFQVATSSDFTPDEPPEKNAPPPETPKRPDIPAPHGPRI